MNGGGATDGNILEGIARAFKPEGALAEDLRRVGFDVRAPKAHYPTIVLLGTLDAIHRHVYPDLSRQEAHRRIGRRMVASFFETVFGKVIQTLLSLLGMSRLLAQVPKVLPMASTGLEVRLEREGPGVLRLCFHREDGVYSPDFIIGGFDGLLQMTQEQLQVDLVLTGPKDFELRVTGL